MKKSLKSGNIWSVGLFSLGFFWLLPSVSLASPFDCANLNTGGDIVACQSTSNTAVINISAGVFTGTTTRVDENWRVNGLEFVIQGTDATGSYEFNIIDFEHGNVLASVSRAIYLTSFDSPHVVSVSFEAVDIASFSQIFLGVRVTGVSSPFLYGSNTANYTAGCINGTNETAPPYSVGDCSAFAPTKDLYFVLYGQFLTAYFPPFGDELTGFDASASLGFSNQELEDACDAKFDSGFLASVPAGICKALVFLLNPSQQSLMNFTGLWQDLRLKPPLGAFSLAEEAFSDIASGSATVTIQTSGFSDFFDEIKTGLGYALWLLLAFWIIHRISRHEI